MATKTAVALEAKVVRSKFAPGQCHHRNAAGDPDCKKAIVGKGANLCPVHESAWQAAAKARRAAKAGVTPEVAKASAASAAKPRATAKPARNSGGQLKRSTPPVQHHPAPVPFIRANAQEQAPNLVQMVAVK